MLRVSSPLTSHTITLLDADKFVFLGVFESSGDPDVKGVKLPATEVRFLKRGMHYLLGIVPHYSRIGKSIDQKNSIACYISLPSRLPTVFSTSFNISHDFTTSFIRV